MLPFEADSREVLLLHPEGAVSRRHLRLRPTKLCVGLAVVCAAVWVGAANYQVNVAYAVSFWLAGFIGVAALMTVRQLTGLTLSADFQEEVFAGDHAAVRLRARSTAKRPRVFWWRGAGAGETAQWQRADVRSETYETQWAIAVSRRGHFPAPLLLEIASTAPFGLFYIRLHAEWQTDAVVFPAPLAHDVPTVERPATSEDAPVRSGGNGDDIAFLSQHIDGVSLQHVAWKSYAKTGELMDKVFEAPQPEADKETFSYRDYPAGTPKDKLASWLTYRVLQAEQAGRPYTLELPDSTIPPQNGQREKCLNALAFL